MTTKAQGSDARVCARCRKALGRGEAVECFTPSWCANWPGRLTMPDDASAVRAREIARKSIAHKRTCEVRSPTFKLGCTCGVNDQRETLAQAILDALTAHGEAIRAAAVRETVAKLLEFVEHDEDCDKHYIPTKDCCCGLDALLLSFPSHPDFLPDAPAPTRGESDG